MVHTDDIKAGADLINRLLFAKGYFKDDIPAEGEQVFKEQRLYYASIDSEELSKKTDEVIENDKLNINMIYQLIQEIEERSAELKVRHEQLKEKDNIITKKERIISDLNDKLAKNNLELKEANQKEIVSSQKLREIQIENKKLRKDMVDLKNINSSIITKKDLEIKKHLSQIDSLQNTIQLIHKRQKRIATATITNNGRPVHGTEADANTSMINTELFDEEMSKLITSLTQLTKSSISMNKDLLKHAEITKSYLQLLLTENTPPTPKFFFLNYQSPIDLSSNSGNDITSEVNYLTQLNKSTNDELIFILTKLHRYLQDFEFGGRTTSASSAIRSSDADKDGEIQELQKQVDKLTANLNSLYGINEKLRARMAAGDVKGTS